MQLEFAKIQQSAAVGVGSLHFGNGGQSSGVTDENEGAGEGNFVV